MASTATGVTRTDRPVGNQFAGSFTIDPASVAAAGTEVCTVTVPGAAVGDTVIVCPQAGLTAGLIVGYARVSAANTVVFTIENNTAGAIDQASGTWNYTIFRGSTRAP